MGSVLSPGPSGRGLGVGRKLSSLGGLSSAVRVGWWQGEPSNWPGNALGGGWHRTRTTLSLEPWGPAAGPLLQEALPPLHPSVAHPQVPCSTHGTSQKSGWRRSLLLVCAVGPRSPHFVCLLGQRLSPEHQEDKDVGGKLHMAKDRDPKAVVQEAAHDGPQGASQGLHGGTKAQHGA